MTLASESLPLSGLKVLSVEFYGAGPFCTQYLSTFGADVIKIENSTQGGDFARTTGPNSLGPEDSLYFQSFNQGKRSLSLDLKDKKGKEILHRLVRSPHETCFVFDREFQSTDDFVKLCLRDGQVVDFGKALTREYETICEWPGFMKMSPNIAARVADHADYIVASGEIEGAYERAITAVLHSEPMGTFGCEDITGIPWVEIDYESDLKKAAIHVIPRIIKFGTEGLKRA